MAIAEFIGFLRRPARCLLLPVAILTIFVGMSVCANSASAQVAPNPAKNTRPVLPGASGDQSASLEADQQRQVGRVYYADGHVDLLYDNTRLRADHVEYNEDTQVAKASGHVQLDYMTQ